MNCGREKWDVMQSIAFITVLVLCSVTVLDKDVGGWITLRWILERYDGVVWAGLIRLRRRLMEGSCVHSNELLVPYKLGSILVAAQLAVFQEGLGFMELVSVFQQHVPPRQWSPHNGL
jgi:hypothetical protein